MVILRALIGCCARRDRTELRAIFCLGTTLFVLRTGGELVRNPFSTGAGSVERCRDDVRSLALADATGLEASRTGRKLAEEI